MAAGQLYHRTVNYRWCWQVWIITSLMMLMVVAAMAGFVYTACIEGDVKGYLFLLIFVILLGVMIGCEGYSPQRLELDDEKIVVLRRYDSIVLYRRDIASIQPLARRDMGLVVAMGGCMGIFGYFGTFSSSRFGQFRIYATSFDDLYLLRLYNGKNVVVGSDRDNPIKLLERTDKELSM